MCIRDRRKFILAAVAAAAILPASAASAHDPRGYRYGHDYRYGYDRGYGYGRGSEFARELRECRRELARADSRREYMRELRECRRELREARRDDRRRWAYRDRYYRGGW